MRVRTEIKGMENNMKHQAHPRLGVNPRKAVELCGICGVEYSKGIVLMGMQNFKYQCPECLFVHYGEPDKDEHGNYRCSHCGQTGKAFSMTELLDNEPVKSGVGTCKECLAKLGSKNVAIIEIADNSDKDRTGRVFFAKPTRDMAKQLNGARTLFMEESACRRSGLYN
jgi:hypothetical protein